MNETKTVIMEREAVEKMAAFLKTVPGVNVIPCDEPLDALKGFVAFHGVGDDEVSIWCAWRFAKPIGDRQPILDEVIVDESEFCDGESHRDWIIKQVKRAITEEGWLKCDGPKERIVGFAKYAPLDSDQKSEGLFFKLTGFKTLPSELIKEVEEWRSKQTQAEMDRIT